MEPIIYDISNQPSLVHTFEIFEQKALEKGILLFVTKEKFFICKKGQLVGDAPLFETKDLGEMMQFIDKF